MSSLSISCVYRDINNLRLPTRPWVSSKKEPLSFSITWRVKFKSIWEFERERETAEIGEHGIHLSPGCAPLKWCVWLSQGFCMSAPPCKQIFFNFFFQQFNYAFCSICSTILTTPQMVAVCARPLYTSRTQKRGIVFHLPFDEKTKN